MSERKPIEMTIKLTDANLADDGRNDVTIRQVKCPGCGEWHTVKRIQIHTRFGPLDVATCPHAGNGLPF